MNQASAQARKAALVFGGSRGIGAAIVDRLATDGFAVAFTYVSSADKAKTLVDRILMVVSRCSFSVGARPSICCRLAWAGSVLGDGGFWVGAGF